jgi:hypothetical protein
MSSAPETNRNLAVLAILIAAMPAGVSAQQVVRRGSEFQVNTYTTGSQEWPSVARGASGDFVVAWSGKGPESHLSGEDVFVRRFDAAGNPLGPDLRVNEWTEATQTRPVVTATTGGQFMVVWSGEGADDGSGIFGRVIDESGQPAGPEFRVNAYTTGAQSAPAVASDGDGNVAVAWTGDGLGDSVGVFGRRLEPDGQPLTPQFRANSYTTGGQSHAAVASLADGRFVVLWHGAGQGNGSGIMARSFAASGQASFPLHFVVNSYGTGDQRAPAVAAANDGDLFMTWHSVGQDGDQEGVYAQRYNLYDNGYHGTEFRVSTYTSSGQSYPKVAEYGGNFITVWESETQDGAGAGVYAQRYNQNFQKIGAEFQVNAYTTSQQWQPVVASDDAGHWVFAWTELSQRDGDGSGIYVQQYAPDLIFDDAFASSDLTRWSLANTDGGDLSVTSAAGLRGTTRGLQALVDDTAGLWVQDTSPVDEPRYRARFYFDTNGFDPGEALNHRRVMLFVAFEEHPVRRLVTVVLRRLNGAYGVRATVRLDDHTLSESPFFAIDDGPHYVELDWKRASGPDAQDGQLALWLDGIAVHVAPNLDNSLSAVDFVRMGAITVKPGASGTLFLDEFRSRRVSPVGAF